MLNMSQINDIRDLKQSGYRISEIHAKTGFDPKTINKYLEKDDFSEDPPIIKRRPSKMDPYKDIITEWLEEDKKHWRKQHHTAKRVYDRLVDEHDFTGSYDLVQKYMQRIRRDSQSRGTQELIWEPGVAEVDFGEADFYEDTDCVRRKYLSMSFPYSNNSFEQVFGGETAECVCQGLKDMFEYMGGVPTLLIFDNATGVGKRIKEKVIETDLFSRFRAHYGFRIRFCNPRSGWEKGNVENKVGTSRRNLFVPIPRYHDIEVFNKELLDKHAIKADEKHYKKGVKISELFEEDRKHFLVLPLKSFNVCRYDYFTADGYGKVCIDGKHFYSTRPEYHNSRVLIGIRAHYIDVLTEEGTVLVRHRRQYGDERTDTTDFSTTLEVLSNNVGAWFNSGIRQETPDLLRDYLDNLPKPELKNNLRLLNDLATRYGYHESIQAMALALHNGSINANDVTVLATRITGYGIDTPPEMGPPLSVYDHAFLPVMEQGGHA